MKKLHKKIIGYSIFPFILTTVFLVGCDRSPESGLGMVLPKGNAESGKTAFTQLKCHHCHIVAGVTFPAHLDSWGEPVKLGGEVHRVKTYGELITSITNPDHIISPNYKSRFDKNMAQVHTTMPILIDEMSVHQLIDLVTFLNAQYKLHIPEYSDPTYVSF